MAILPYIEQEYLYREIHLDEPWDSPHNLQFLDKMPPVYRSPGEQPPQANVTFYRVFVGPGTPFAHDGLRIAHDFPNGSSNIIGAIEAGEAVPWTKPDELTYRPDEALPPLGGMFRGGSWLSRQRDKRDGFHAAMLDGSVRWFERDTDAEMLRALIAGSYTEPGPPP